jgi:FkbM family methyltransferase
MHMKTKLQPKRWIGRRLIAACEAWPVLKPCLARWGLRTRKEWFDGRVVHVQRAGDGEFKLASATANYLSFELFWRGAGYYEPITTLLLRELVCPGDTFIDAGANVGFYTLMLGTGCPGIHVRAFEPNPAVYALLKANVAVNQLDDVTCEPCALSNATGTAQLTISESDMSASLHADFDAHRTARLTVPTITLDDYAARHLIPGRCVIKVDVEGHEGAFFEGARRLLDRLQPEVIAEVALEYPPATLRLLRDAGYRFYPITDEGLIESDKLKPVIRDSYVFLNYLLSVRSPRAVAETFERIRDRVKRLDLEGTSKRLAPTALRAFRIRQRIRELELRALERPAAIPEPAPAELQLS